MPTRASRVGDRRGRSWLRVQGRSPPTDMPWNVREMHVRDPDGHVCRISRGVEEDVEQPGASETV